MKCKNVSFDICLENIVDSGNEIIKIVICKKEVVVQIIMISALVRFHCS
jgi:hypothetical protein